MARRMAHNATITLKLPFDLDTAAKVAALRAAGVPVDAEGNARQGFLFVRSGDGCRSRVNIFRWFADEVGLAPHDAGIAPQPRERDPATSPSHNNALDGWLAQVLAAPDASSIAAS